MQGEVIPIGRSELVGEVAKVKVEGYRFVTMTCVEIDEASLDLLYHFDRGYELKHLRLTVARDDPVPSVSGVYFAAFLVENEIQDQFALRFEGLAIDYGRTLYFDEENRAAPLCRFATGSIERSR